MRALSMKYGLALLITLTIAGCDKGFEELNTNPNEPTTANPDQLFTEILAVSAGQFGTGIHSEIWTLEVWTQMMADINGVQAGSFYNFSGSWNDELWGEWYTRVLSPCNQLIRLTQDDPFLVNKTALARIMRAYTFHRLTDLYGDIPYTEALNGFNPDGALNFTPAYDSQQDIYLDLLNELESAVASLDPTKSRFGSADVLYNDDLDAWKKFANSLRLRMAMRLSEADPGTAQQHIQELLTDETQLISSNFEGAHFQFVNDNEHPFFELYVAGQGLRNPSHYLVEMLKADQDPRLHIYAQTTPSSTALNTEPYVGVPNLKTSGELNNLGINTFTTSLAGDYFLDVSVKGTTLSYAEVCFLKAEAALRGWGGNQSAAAYYEEGVRSAMSWINTPTDSINQYLAGPGAFDGTMEAIITQKWISLVYRDSYEAFAELRRTGYPILTDDNNTPIDMTQFPTRFAYPPSEWTLNAVNVSAVGLSNNDMSTPVWWDQ